MPSFLKPSLNWFLIFVPITILARYQLHSSDSAIFVLSCLAIVPLAAWLGTATEHIAVKAGEGVGGLLNATFGNAAELIIAIVALRAGLLDVVKASLTGSIIGNILLVMGASAVAGGMKYSEQDFNTTAARAQASMLTLASISLIAPAAFHQFTASHEMAAEHSFSVTISVILLVMYVCGLIFSLITHKELFSGSLPNETDTDCKENPAELEHWSMGKAISILAISTVFIAWMSEVLVGSVEHAAHAFGMPSVFVGVIIVALVGNAAEHSSAVLMAMKNKMDLSFGIAIGSSIQIALFVAPVLVLVSYAIAPQPMDLVFTSAEVLAIVLSTYIIGQIVGDGKSNWFEGVQLLAVYIIIGFFFYFLPEQSALPLHN